MNDYYREIIKKVHPDTNPNMPIHICQEVNAAKDNPSKLKEIARKYNIKVSFVENTAKIEFNEGTIFTFTPQSINRLLYGSNTGVILRVRDIERGRFAGYKEYTVKITAIDKPVKFQALKPDNHLVYCGKMTSDDLYRLKKQYIGVGRNDIDPSIMRKFESVGLKPNTDYSNQEVYVWISPRSVYKLVSTTKKSVKYRKFENKSGLGITSIDNVWQVDIRNTY